MGFMHARELFQLNSGSPENGLVLILETAVATSRPLKLYQLVVINLSFLIIVRMLNLKTK